MRPSRMSRMPQALLARQAPRAHAQLAVRALVAGDPRDALLAQRERAAREGGPKEHRRPASIRPVSGTTRSTVRRPHEAPCASATE